MKQLIAIGLLSLWIVSCGKESKPAPVPAVTPPPAGPTAKGWTPDQVSNLKNTCVQNGLRLFPEYQKTQFETYCQCLVDAIATRWGYQEFVNNKNTHLSTLENDGSDQACITKAGF